MGFYSEIKAILYWLDDSLKHDKGRKHLKTVQHQKPHIIGWYIELKSVRIIHMEMLYFWLLEFGCRFIEKNEKR